MIDGYVHPDFQAVADTFVRQVGSTDGAGGAVAAWHRGECVLDVWAGEAAPGVPWRSDTLAMCFSTSKGVASTALHVLADRGMLDYEAPVAEYWPEFGANGKHALLVRHVMTHSAGLHGIRRLIDRADRMFDWDHMCAALAAAKPSYEPGTHHGYHALTYGWLAGELVRRIDGRPIDVFVHDEFVEPLGLDGLNYGVEPHDRHRIAPLIPLNPAAGLRQTPPAKILKPVGKAVNRAGGMAISMLPIPINTRRMTNAFIPRGFADHFWREDVLDAVIPAANGFFTARSLAKFYAVLANRGELNGVRLVSPETVAKMNHVYGSGLDLCVIAPMQWRLGYHMVGTSRGILPNAFGHYGFGGSGAWCDPSRDLSVAYVPNRGAGSPFGDLRIVRIGGTAVQCADRRTWAEPKPRRTPPFVPLRRRASA